MPDKYSAVRNASFESVAQLLGIDLTRFKKKKADWNGYCPVHNSQDNNGCFSYNIETGMFFCFSCHAKGKGAIDLTKLVKGINFTSAIELLSGIPLEAQNKPQNESKPLPAVIESADELKPFTGSYHKFFQPCEWLSNRIPNQDVINTYGVGFYDNPARKSAYAKKVLISIKRFSDGQTMGYLARSITDEQPKYFFPANFPKHLFLFGASELKNNGVQLPLRLVYLVESPFAVMKFASYGIACVSPFGWSISDEQIQILCQLAKGIVYLPDSNKRADAVSVAGKLSQSLWLRMPEFPTTDPEYLSLSQIQAL
jgi:DNA primase